MPVGLKCCFKCLGRSVCPFDSGAVFPDYHTGSGYISPASASMHSIMIAAEARRASTTLACISLPNSLSSGSLIATNSTVAMKTKMTATATAAMIQITFILKNVLIGLWNSSGAVRPHRVKKVVCPPFALVARVRA